MGLLLYFVFVKCKMDFVGVEVFRTSTSLTMLEHAELLATALPFLVTNATLLSGSWEMGRWRVLWPWSISV